jgi:mono/diheme cytochrome c family protein
VLRLKSVFWKSQRWLLACTAALATSTVCASDRTPEKVFEDTCAYCHGHYIAPGITVIEQILGRGLPPALTKTYVRNGLGRMPAFRVTEISDSELEALAKWIETSTAPPLPPLPPGAKPPAGPDAKPTAEAGA